VGVTPWEFKSPLRHHLQIGWLPELTSIPLGNSLKVERLILDQVVGVRIPVPQPNLRVFLCESTPVDRYAASTGAIYFLVEHTAVCE
jgi:hypothetical protein